MFLNYYIDDMYGGIIQDYDQNNLTKVWYDFTTISDIKDDVQLYYFHEFPITVE